MTRVLNRPRGAPLPDAAAAVVLVPVTARPGQPPWPDRSNWRAVIAAAAARRGAGRVVVVIDDKPASARWRRALDGDLGRAVQRRLGHHVVVETMGAAVRSSP